MSTFYIAAVMVSETGSAAATQYGPFNSDTQCSAAARELVRGGNDITESNGVITAQIAVKNGGVKIYFYYRLNCLEK